MSKRAAHSYQLELSFIRLKSGSAVDTRLSHLSVRFLCVAAVEIDTLFLVANAKRVINVNRHIWGVAAAVVTRFSSI